MSSLKATYARKLWERVAVAQAGASETPAPASIADGVLVSWCSRFAPELLHDRAEVTYGHTWIDWGAFDMSDDQLAEHARAVNRDPETRYQSPPPGSTIHKRPSPCPECGCHGEHEITCSRAYAAT